MASGTKILVSFCAMIIGVLVLYYGVIMPANEPVISAQTEGSISQKMAADPKPDSIPGLDVVGNGQSPPLVEPALSQREGGLTNPQLPETGESGTMSTDTVRFAGPKNDSSRRSQGPLDIVPLSGLDHATEVTTDDPAGSTDGPGPAATTPTLSEPADVRPVNDDREPATIPVGRSTPASAESSGTASPSPKPRTPGSLPQPGNAPAVTEYTVKAGDTGVSIAKDWFGDGNKWTLISKANPWVDFNRLQIGQKIKLPPKNARAAPAKQETVSDSSTYLVRPGDTLIKIARSILNDAGRWEEIYAANRGLIGDDPAELEAGMKLKLPSPSPTKPSGR